MEYLIGVLAATGGVLAGLLVGAIPGLTATMAIALLVPFTFYMDTLPAMAMLLGLYVAAMFGGSIPAILVGIPGTPAATATRLDGYPMAQRGQAGLAIGYAAVGSFVGSIVSVLVLALVSGPIARFSLYFGSPEYFALALIGLTLCISLASKSVLKGIISGFIGVLLALVGADQITGYQRFTFGIPGLWEGIPFIPAMIGLFGLAEILDRLEHLGRGDSAKEEALTNVILSWPHIRKILGVALRGGVIGSLVGAIPGTGGNVAAFLNYDVTKRLSKRGDEFGQGVAEGVVAAESGNSGVTGGALVPLLTFGIPGDSVAAVLLGALLIHGLRPGPALFTEGSLIYGVFALMTVGCVLTFLLSILMARQFARLITLPDRYLVPLITLLCIVGAYAMQSSLFDVYLMLVFGIMGYAMKKAGFSPVPMVLGLILGEIMETNFRRSLLLSGGNLGIFLERPLTLVFLIMVAVLLLAPLWTELRGGKRLRADDRQVLP